MRGRTALGEQIMKHWREHRPRMVSDLERTGRLEEAVQEAQDRTGDLMHELVAVQKMDYHAAWEIAMREWTEPPELEQPGSQARKPPSKRPRRKRHRATSE